MDDVAVPFHLQQVLFIKPVMRVHSVHTVKQELHFPEFTSQCRSQLVWATDIFCMKFGSGSKLMFLLMLGRPGLGMRHGSGLMMVMLLRFAHPVGYSWHL